MYKNDEGKRTGKLSDIFTQDIMSTLTTWPGQHQPHKTWRQNRIKNFYNWRMETVDVLKVRLHTLTIYDSKIENTILIKRPSLTSNHCKGKTTWSSVDEKRLANRKLCKTTSKRLQNFLAIIKLKIWKVSKIWNAASNEPALQQLNTHLNRSSTLKTTVISGTSAERVRNTARSEHKSHVIGQPYRGKASKMLAATLKWNFKIINQIWIPL